MDCFKFEELAQRRLDGPLTPAEESFVQQHLKACDLCRALHGRLLKLDCLLRAGLSEPPTVDWAKQAQQTAQAAARRFRLRKSRGLRVLRDVIIAAAAAFLIHFTLRIFFAPAPARQSPTISAKRPDKEWHGHLAHDTSRAGRPCHWRKTGEKTNEKTTAHGHTFIEKRRQSFFVAADFSTSPARRPPAAGGPKGVSPRVSGKSSYIVITVDNGL